MKLIYLHGIYFKILCTFSFSQSFIEISFKSRTKKYSYDEVQVISEI